MLVNGFEEIFWRDFRKSFGGIVGKSFGWICGIATLSFFCYNIIIMENIERYKHLNKYLKEKFGERTLKICIDGGFTCPNRDGSKGIGGCIFCSEKGSGEHIKNIEFDSNNLFNYNESPLFICNNSAVSISEQVKRYFNSYKAKRANKFIAYFQNFTNTYDTLENLKLKYDSALIDNRIVGLEVATRPDCITEDTARLLKNYTNKYYVCVELGLQTANEKTGKFINRCYTNDDFSKAITVLNKYGIDVVVHIMIGLPTEGDKNIETLPDIKNTVDFLNKHNIQGLKIHSCYIVKNTKLEKLYYDGKYQPITLEQYIEQCAYVITHINSNIVIHRISGDAPKELLVAPSWNSHKKWVLNGLDKYLRENDLWQGKYWH